nr:hypothetical protein [Tanacetum cinerariifolium]
LELSSTDAYRGRRQVMTDSDRQELKFCKAVKVIIHYFMSQHKSISKRQDSPYHTVDNDDFETYKKFIALSTGSIPPKKGRGKGAQGTKETVIPKKATVASKKKPAKKKESSDEKYDEQKERLIKRKPRGVVLEIRK